MGNSLSTSCDCTWAKTYNEIKKNHDEAYALIDAAIKFEEEEEKHKALEKYKEGIAVIDRALTIQVDCPDNPEATWDQACDMIRKMKKTRGEVLMRINTIQTSPDFFVPPEAPPSYDEAMSETSSNSDKVPRTYRDLAAALHNLSIEDKTPNARNATLLYSCDNVKIYFILPDGTCASFHEANTLKIVAIYPENENQEEASAQLFLQVGDWFYPLIPAVSPCYRSDIGTFMFPDVNAPIPDCYVGIALPADVDQTEFISLLEEILHGIVSAEYATKPPKRSRREIPSVSRTISTGLINGAWYIQQGLIKGASKAGQLINYGTPKIISHLKPAQENQEIPPRVLRGFQTAKNVTGAATQVTGYVVGKIGQSTMALGRYLAPHVQKQGTKLLTTGFKMDENVAHERIDSVLTVAAGAVEGLATVYTGLEESSRILGQNITNNTVKIVEHKYGGPAGDLAENTIYTMGNLYSLNYSMKYFQPKSIAKTAVKSAGKAVIEDFRTNHTHSSTDVAMESSNLTIQPTSVDLNLPSTSKGLN